MAETLVVRLVMPVVKGYVVEKDKFVGIMAIAVRSHRRVVDRVKS